MQARCMREITSEIALRSEGFVQLNELLADGGVDSNLLAENLHLLVGHDLHEHAPAAAGVLRLLRRLLLPLHQSIDFGGLSHFLPLNLLVKIRKDNRKKGNDKAKQSKRTLNWGNYIMYIYNIECMHIKCEWRQGIVSCAVEFSANYLLFIFFARN